MIPEMRRPLPSFDKWLEDHGDGTRGDGFGPLVDLMRRTREQSSAHLSPDELSFLRMWQGTMIAVVELCNIEHQQGRTPDQIVQTMPRVLAASAMYATASVLKDEAPHRLIAKLVTEEFRAAAKVAADQLIEKAG